MFALFLLGGLLFLLILREGRKHGFHQARDTLTVSGRDHKGLDTETKFIEFRARDRAEAFSLIDGEIDLAARFAQRLRDTVILRRNACSRVDNKDNGIRFFNRQLGLRRHVAHHALGPLGLKTARVDHDVRARAHLAVAVVAIKVRDNGIPSLGEPVVECGFPDIRTTDKRNNRKHERNFLKNKIRCAVFSGWLTG